MISRRNQKIQEIKMSLNSISIIRRNTELIEKKIFTNDQKKSLQITTDSSPGFSFQNCQEKQEVDDNSFFEKYTLIKKIGEGANGTVHLCIHKRSQKQFAVKIFSMDDEHIRELKQNFLFMKQLKHQGIVQYKAIYFDHQKRTTYLVMEYFPYSTLQHAIIRDEKELKNIAIKLLDALQYIHHRNISHRDIKPENILYDHLTKKIKLIDFGISKKTFLRGVRRDMLTIIGTPFYMAQEVYLGGGYDERIDLWALGVSLYKLVTGVTPFESEYHGDTINKIIEGAIKFDGTVWNQYSPYLKDYISCLLKPKDERISIKNAKKHRWLHHQLILERKLINKLINRLSPSKNNRKLTFDQQGDEHFYHELKKTGKFAISKEEGDLQMIEQCDMDGEGNSKKKSQWLKLLRLMSQNEYDLIQSDDESKMAAPWMSQTLAKIENQHNLP